MAQDPKQQISPLSIEIPLNSAFERTYLRFSTSFIEINFGRPNVNGREIFGKVVPYNHVWRSGADWSTEIHFGEDVKIQGKIVEKGKYELQSIPRENGNWQLFLTKKAWSWEKFATTPPEDAILFEVQARQRQEVEETLLFYFSGVSDKEATLNLRWDRLHLALKIETKSDQVAIEKIDEIMKNAKSEDEKPYFLAAQYYYTHQIDLQKAFEFSSKEVARQIKTEKPFWWPFLLHGRILAALNKPKEAKKYFELAVQHLGNRPFYFETILKKEINALPKK